MRDALCYTYTFGQDAYQAMTTADTPGHPLTALGEFAELPATDLPPLPPHDPLLYERLWVIDDEASCDKGTSTFLDGVVAPSTKDVGVGTDGRPSPEPEA